MRKKYWQIAAGSSGRDYSDLFIKYGIAFVGGKQNVAKIEQVKVGDVVVLKKGLHQIMAVGEVVERNGNAVGIDGKSWLEDFDGWRLPAYCYVDWHVPEKLIETDGLTRATIQRLPQKKHQTIADNILQLPKSVFDPEPKETKPIEDEELLEHLIKEGLSPNAADELTNTLRKIRLLANYYYTQCRWEDVREHETRTFLVAPLFLTLGWAEQQLKIELPCKKGKVDLACFSKPYARVNEQCLLIVETKDFASGLHYAPEQAHRYAEDFPLCKGVLVSNGYCYKAYKRKDDNTFDLKPYAYLNLLKPRDKYPLDPDNVHGALEVLTMLLPNTLRT